MMSAGDTFDDHRAHFSEDQSIHGINTSYSSKIINIDVSSHD